MADSESTGETAATTWVALLRGINVGKHKRVAMADLRALLSALGYGDVRTLLQSGNAVFTLAEAEAEADTVDARLEREISARIAADLGLDVTVVVRSAGELAAVVTANPFVAQGVEPKQLHVAFLAAEPPADRLAQLEPDAYPPDELAVGDRAVYLRRPNGIQGTKIPDLSKLLAVPVTERNWNTTTRLHALTT